MGDILLLAPTTLVGEKYAIANGISRRDVISPRSANWRTRGRTYSKLIVVDDVKLSQVQMNSIYAAFYDCPCRIEIFDKLESLVNHD